MKKGIITALCVLMIAALIFTGCTAQEAEPTPEPTPSATETPQPTPEPTPTPTPEPASVVLMDVPEDQVESFPIPEEYIALDPAADPSIPVNLGYTLYAFTDVDGVVQYRAFGQKLNPADQSFAGEQGWYAVTITDEPLTAETIKAMPAGERILIIAEDGSVADTYTTGDTEKPFEESALEGKTAIRKVVTFDALTAVPVDLEAEAATYMVEEEQPEDGADDVPINNDSASSRKSGNSGNGGSSSNSSSGSESSASSGGSSVSGSGSSESTGETNLEDMLGDSFEVTFEGKEYTLPDGSTVYY